MSAAQKDGGPAFPASARRIGSNLIETIAHGGMSLRDYFAGQALPTVISVCVPSERKEGETLPQMFARKSYEVADAMLAERGA